MLLPFPSDKGSRGWVHQQGALTLWSTASDPDTEVLGHQEVIDCRCCPQRIGEAGARDIKGVPQCSGTWPFTIHA